MRDDFLDIVVSLPFQSEPNTGFGILIKTYLDATTFHHGDQITPENAQTEAVASAKREALSFIEQSFSSVKAPLQEVERGFRFWDTVCHSLEKAKDRSSSPSDHSCKISPSPPWLLSRRPWRASLKRQTRGCGRCGLDGRHGSAVAGACICCGRIA